MVVDVDSETEQLKERKVVKQIVFISHVTLYMGTNLAGRPPWIDKRSVPQGISQCLGKDPQQIHQA